MKKLKYLFLIMVTTFMSVSFANAEVESFEPRFVGYTLDEEFTIGANSSISGPINFMSTQPIDSNFAFVDVCTTGYEPTLWITAFGNGQISASTNWYKLNTPCNTGGYKADVYRQILYISSSDFGSCSDFGTCYRVTATGRLFNNTKEYATSTRILHIGLSNDIPLNDIILENGKTQTDLLRDIVDSLSNNDSTMQDVLESNQAIKEQTEKLKEETEKLNENITSTDGPTNLGALDNSAGWLPAGPVDSILNLPLSLINSLLSAISSTCQPLNITFPFVDINYQLPCISSIYSRINGLNAIIDLIGYTVGVLILYYYFKHLYKWIDSKLSMENDDDWGGI